MHSHCVIPLPVVQNFFFSTISREMGVGGKKANAPCFISALVLFHWGVWSLLSALLVHVIHLWEMGVTKHKEESKKGEEAVDRWDITQQAFQGLLTDRRASSRKNGVWSLLHHGPMPTPLFECTDLALNLSMICLIKREAEIALWDSEGTITNVTFLHL